MANKHYTLEEKIENLVTLAKAAGRYTEAETNAEGKADDYLQDARRSLLEAYETFCEWRHEEPYIVDEVKALRTASNR
jgi:hypothetical protein